MPRFLLLVGLPGSGKTCFGREIGARFLDDLAQNGGLSALQDVGPDEAVTISDYCLISEPYRQAAATVLERKFPGCVLEWLYWENDPVQCWKNVKSRQDGRIISRETIFQASKKYFVPSEVKTRPVFVNPLSEPDQL